MTTINDIVLVHLEDTPVSFARVENILPDTKKDWYQIKLLMLQVPLQVVTWILKEDYINGDEFHMNGKRMKLVKVESPLEGPDMPPSKSGREKSSSSPDPLSDDKKGNIVSFADFKKG